MLDFLRRLYLEQESELHICRELLVKKFNIIERLSKEDVRRYIDLLEDEVAPRLARSKKGYARGRLYAWLNWRPALDGESADPQPTGDLWSALTILVPGIETAECWLNGRDSSAGIHPHRDASYAERVAYILNLGPTRFRIWLPRSEPAHCALACVKRNAKFDEYVAELKGGELIRFDCKMLHGSTSDADTRWGVGMWTISPAWKAKCIQVSL